MTIFRACIALSIHPNWGIGRACFATIVGITPYQIIPASYTAPILDVGSLWGTNTLMVSPIIYKSGRAGFAGLKVFIPEFLSFALDTFLTIPVWIVFRAITAWIGVLLVMEELCSRPTNKEE